MSMYIYIYVYIYIGIYTCVFIYAYVYVYQSVSLSKRFLKGPGDSWEHWLEDVGLSWEQELGVGCTETQRNAVVLPRKLTWGDARLSFY